MGKVLTRLKTGWNQASNQEPVKNFIQGENNMFEDIKEVRDLRKKYNYKMFTSGVDTFREYEEIEAKALKSGELDQKYKELIGLAISIVSMCYGCVEYHTTQAVEHGATRAEIAETVAVAVVMGGGTAQWPARYTFKVLDELEAKQGA
jgi:AhpD family alkylhydroperoxidase